MSSVKFIVNVEGCIMHNDKILMILRGDGESHAPNTLAFPGGQVEFKDGDIDTLEDALKREICEEIGLKIKEDLKYLESKKFVSEKGNNILDIVMFCKIDDVTDIKIDNTEVKDFMWMSIDEILNDARTPEWIKLSVNLARLRLDL